MSDNIDPRDFHPELLVLLEDRPEAQRLLVTWKKAWQLYSGRGFTGTVVMPELKEDDEFTRAWSKISTVDPLDIEQLCPVLFVNELLLPEGDVDPVAYAWVRSRMLEMIQAGST